MMIYLQYFVHCFPSGFPSGLKKYKHRIYTTYYRITHISWIISCHLNFCNFSERPLPQPCHTALQWAIAFNICTHPVQDTCSWGVFPWRIPVSKTWIPEEFQPQKSESLRNFSLKTWTPEKLQPQKLESLRNCSLKTWTPEEFLPK